MKFYPYKNGGRTSFSHAEGGGGAQPELEVLAILMGGGHAKLSPYKRRGTKMFTLSCGRGGVCANFPIS